MKKMKRTTFNLNTKEIDKLFIFKGDLYVGELKRTAQGCSLSFAQEYLDRPSSLHFTYRMKKNHRPLEVKGINLHPFFAGLLPEGVRLQALLRAVKTSQDDLFSLFAALGASCIGDIYAKFDRHQQNDQGLSPKISEIDFYEYFDLLTTSQVGHLNQESIPGVQEKVSASQISFPLNVAKKNKAYILKINPRDKPNLVQNELICLQIAQKCGLRVNKARLVEDKNNNKGILIERFDRVSIQKETKKLQMIHQEDACQFLDRYPADKYRLSLREVADGIALLASARKIEILELLKLYCFSYLIGNGDLHGKNISLFSPRGPEDVTLTPAYDILTTVPYGDFNMAIKLDGRDDNIKRKHIVDFAKRYEISEKSTTSMLDKLLERLSKNREMLLQIPLENKKIKLLNQLVNKRCQDLSLA